MGILNIFSKRQKALRGEAPDVYQYETIPKALKVQIIHIIQDTVGSRSGNGYGQTLSEKVYHKINKDLCKEYGQFSLANRNDGPIFDRVYEYFFEENDVEKCLDIIELTFLLIHTYVRENFIRFQREEGTTQEVNDAIDELNIRFKQHGIGYEFSDGEIIRVDSQFLHSEVVKPALNVLQVSKFLEGAKQEFLSAHSHYRHKKYKESLNECLKAFESTLKAICKKHNWEHSANDTAKRLLNICLTNGLVPTYMKEQFNQFLGLLSSGVPTIRNKESGHGQGAEVKNVSPELVSYTLHLTASNILFLSECEKKL